MQLINTTDFDLIHGGSICTCSTLYGSDLYRRFFLRGDSACTSWCCRDNRGKKWKFEMGCILPKGGDCSNLEHFQPTRILCDGIESVKIINVPFKSYTITTESLIEQHDLSDKSSSLYIE